MKFFKVIFILWAGFFIMNNIHPLVGIIFIFILLGMDENKSKHTATDTIKTEFKKHVKKILPQYVKEKEIIKENSKFFDEFFSMSPTENQKIAIVSDSSNNLIVAGAGTGKTTTILGKILFLLEVQKYNQTDILVIVFTNTARIELDDRLVKKIGKHEIKMMTLHAYAKEIISQVEDDKVLLSKHLDSQKSALIHIESIIRELCETNSSFKKDFVNFFKYFSVEDLDDTFDNPEDYLNYLKSNPLMTLKGEAVKSYGELCIANFLYIHNLPYEYEDIYTSSSGRRHKPDFHINNTEIWIEYFGIDKYGNTRKDISSSKYKSDMQWKRAEHQLNNTILIEIFFANFQDNDWEQRLRRNLKNNKISCFEKSIEDIYKNLPKKTLTNYSKLILRFIDLHKSKNKKKLESDDIRKNKFLVIYYKILKKYEDSLKGVRDFNDLLNDANKYLNTEKYTHDFSYIIVDEFQDTSLADYAFIKALLKRTAKSVSSEPKLYCVGDDWQSIYGFRGSESYLMNDFDKHFNRSSNKSTSIKLDTTFRFDNNINDVTSSFLQKNPNQIPKKLISVIKKKSPSVFLHWIEPISIEDSILEWVSKYSKDKKYNNKNLLILYRYNQKNSNEKERFGNKIHQNIINSWKGNGVVNFKTLHQSKGTESDVVLIAGIEGIGNNLTKGTFPSQYSDDSILDMVLEKHDDYPFSEERKLLYVGMTRAKYQVHLLCDFINISSFANELANDKKVKVIECDSKSDRKCPSCGIGSIRNKTKDPLKKNYYLCNREPICDFSGFTCTQEKCGGLVIRKKDKGVCTKCEHEYLGCKVCDSGIIAVWKNENKGCHTFPWTRCKG